MSTPQNVEQLLATASELPHGLAKINLIQEAVHLADQIGDVESQYNARIDLVDAGEFGGMDNVALVAFSWCLSAQDKDLINRDYLQLLWRYKWICSTATDFPSIGMDRINHLLGDMRVRMVMAGSNLQGYWQTYRSVMWAVNRRAEYFQAHRSVCGLTRDFLGNCSICEASSRADYEFRCGRPHKGVAILETILADGDCCATIPQTVHGTLMYQYHLTEDDEKAVSSFRKSHRMTKTNPGFVSNWGEMIEYLALTKNHKRAEAALKSWLPIVLEVANPSDRLTFLRSTCFLLREMTSNRVKSVSMKLPPEHPVASSSKGRVDVGELLKWTEAEIKQLAQQFDRRNGNRREMQINRELTELHEHVRSVSIA